MTAFEVYIQHCRGCDRCQHKRLCVEEQRLWKAVCANPKREVEDV